MQTHDTNGEADFFLPRERGGGETEAKRMTVGIARLRFVSGVAHFALLAVARRS